jgi:ABC-2 type transport system ATP-binding protein
MEEADKLCDRVAIMDHGRILALDTPAQLKASIGADTLVTVQATGDHERLADHLKQTLEGVTSTRVIEGGAELQIQGSDRLLVRVLDAAESAGYVVGDIKVSETTLETVFISLTGKELRE